MIATGSSAERLLRCRASAVLPRVWRERGEDADAGTARHGYLERISNGETPEASLAKVPPAFRDTCAAIPLDALGKELRLSAEVALAYRPRTDTARVLGQGLARDYSTVADDEIPMTIDVAGVAPDFVEMADYKTGHQPVTAARNNWQVRIACLALARVYDRDEARGAIVYIREGRDPFRDRAAFDGFDLLGFADELRRAWDRALADRAAYARGEHIEPTAGDHCRYCPSAHACPAKVGLIRAALGGELRGPVGPADIARLWPQVGDALKLLGALKSEMMAAAAREPIRLSVAPDGAETWLGEVVGEGNEKLDAKIALDVAATTLSIPPEQVAAFQREVCELEVTKTALEAAVKARVPKGKGAAAMRTVLQGIRDRDGAHRPMKRSVETYTIQTKKAANE